MLIKVMRGMQRQRQRDIKHARQRRFLPADRLRCLCRVLRWIDQVQGIIRAGQLHADHHAAILAPAQNEAGFIRCPLCGK